MAPPKQEQLGTINILDEDNSGTVDNSGALNTNTSGTQFNTSSSSPGTNTIWATDDTPSRFVFTNSDGYDISATTLKYTVGNINTGAQFTTIQEAIDQAQADGADFNTPAEIIIFPEVFNESLVINCGGIILSGSVKWIGPFISGSITYNAFANEGNFFGMRDIFVGGTVTITGSNNVDGVSVAIENCYFSSLFDMSGAPSTVTTALIANQTLFSAIPGPVISLPTTGVKNLELTSCRILTNETDQCFSYNGSANLFYNEFRGQVEQATSASGIQRYHYCYFETESQDCLVLDNTVTVEVVNCAFEIDGTSAHAINKSGTGRLDHAGNTYFGSLSDPPINIIAGTEQEGSPLETKIGPYKFPTSPTTLFNMPSADGNTGDVLSTDGSGNLSFSPASGGGQELFGDVIESRADLAALFPPVGNVFTITSNVGVRSGSNVTLNANERIVIDVISGGSLDGVDGARSQISGDISTDALIQIDTSGTSNFLMQHLRVSNSSGIAIEFNSADSGTFKIENCEISGTDCIFLSASIETVFIKNCKLTNNYPGSGLSAGIRSDGGALPFFVADSNEFRTTGNPGANGGQIYWDASQIDGFYHVLNNTFFVRTNVYGIHQVQSSRLTSILNNRFELDSGSSAIAIYSNNEDFDDAKISNNHFNVGTSTTVPAISLVGLGTFNDSQITNNYCEGVFIETRDGMFRTILSNNSSGRTLYRGTGTNCPLSRCTVNGNLKFGTGTENMFDWETSTTDNETDRTSFVGNSSQGGTVFAFGNNASGTQCVICGNVAVNGSMISSTNPSNVIAQRGFRNSTFSSNFSSTDFRTPLAFSAANDGISNPNVSRGNFGSAAYIPDFD